MGTWIEILTRASNILAIPVVPSWARGLKFDLVLHAEYQLLRRALMGTWIEIIRSLSFVSAFYVVPSWARGLKYDGFYIVLCFRKSCPHGHVD